jgi:hypothetical protein
VLACARYAEANLNALLELDINPVIVRPAALGAVAVDALIRLVAGTTHAQVPAQLGATHALHGWPERDTLERK